MSRESVEEEEPSDSSIMMRLHWRLGNLWRKVWPPISGFVAQLHSFLEQKGLTRLHIWSHLPPFALVFIGLYWCMGYSGLLVDLLFSSVMLAVLSVLFLQAQDLLLYYPYQPADARSLCLLPGQFGLPSESITITTRDGVKLHALLLKHENSMEHSTMIMFHGNAGNIGHRLPNAAHFFNDCDMNVLLMEYRGYGKSGGTISEEGLYDDALSTINYVQSRRDLSPNRIVLHGRSLGGAIAAYAASCPENAGIQALILENTFTSLPDIAHCVLNIWLVKSIPSWCYKNKYPTLSRISQVRQPTLFLSGRADTLVPPIMMDRLHKASGSHNATVAHFREGTHNETWTEPGYFDAVSTFMLKLGC